MKKRFLTFFLCTALIFSAGCGKNVVDSLNISDEQVTEHTTNDDANTENQDSADTQNTNSENADSENADSENTTEDTSSIETNTDITENVTSQLYSVISTHHTESTSSEDDSVLLMYSDYDTIEIQGDGYDTLKTAIAKWQESSQAVLQKSITEYTDCAREDSMNFSDFYGYSVSQTYQSMRSDNHVLSLLESYQEYTGGAHPSHYNSGINFDVTTGELLTLENIALDSEQFSQQAIAYVLDYLKNSDIGKEGGFYPDYETLVKESFHELPWYFTAAGITLVYNPYAIAPYAAGSIEVLLPSTDFDSLLKEEYRTDSGVGYACVPEAAVVSYTSSATGETHTVMITNEVTADQNNYEDNTPYITLDGNRTVAGEWSSWSINAYIIKQNNGRVLFAFENSFMSDDYQTILYDITNGTLEEFDSAYASIYVPGTDILTLNTYLYVLGTYSGYRTYDISGTDGMKPLTEEYTIPSAYSNLTTIKELPVTNSAGENVLLPVGSVLKAIATDENSYIRLKDISTEEEYTIHFTREDYHILIDGVDEYEYFEMISYAG